MKWSDASEIVGGYILSDKIDPNAVNVDDMYPPYAHIVTMKRDGAAMPDIVSKDFSAVDACLHAVERVNGTMKNPMEYLKILKDTATLAKNAVDVEKVLKRMKEGETVTSVELLAIADKMEKGYSRWIPLAEVEPQKIKFIKTGYAPLDKYVGGIPYANVTIIAGTPGIGKTSLAL